MTAAGVPRAEIFSIGGSKVLSSDSSGLDDDAWHFLAMTCDADDVAIYDDANSKADTHAVTLGTLDRTAIAHRADSGGTIPHTGSIDQPMIFDVVLTADEIAYMYNAGAGRTYSDMVAGFSAGDANCPDPSDCVFAPDFSEHSGVRMDESANELHITPSGIAKGVTFELDDSEYADASDAAAWPFPATMGCSFKTANAANMGMVWLGDKDASADMVALEIDNGSVRARSEKGAVIGTATSAADTYDDDAWHTAAAAFNATASRKVYVDGAAAVEDTTSVSITGVWDRTSIGRYGDLDPDRYFDGTLDNVWVYGTAGLTDANIAWLSSGGVAGGPATYQDVVRSQHADNPGTTNLAAWWQLNEDDPSGGATLVNVHNPGTLDLTTASGGAGPVTVTGLVVDLPIAVAGLVQDDAEIEDRALEFDGVDQDARAATSAAVAYPFTLSGFFKTTSSARMKVLSVSSSSVNEEAIEIDTNAIALSVGDGVGRSTGGAVNDGEWHLAVAVFTSDVSRKVSVDGAAFAATNTTDTNADPTAYTTTIIGDRNVATDDFNGVIDECMVWDSELSATDASELYNSGIGLLARDLVSGDSTLTSAKVPIHAWSLSRNNVVDAGEDIGSTGGIDLTLTNSPTDVEGIPAGQSLGGLISLVEDQTANGNDLTQATLSKRPEVVHVSDGTGVALKFDGVDDYLKLASFGSQTQPNDMFVSCQFLDPTGAEQFVVDGVAAPGRPVFYKQGANQVSLYAGSVLAGSNADADVHTFLASYDGASSNLWVDGGSADASGDVGSETPTGLTVGSFVNGETGSWWNGSLRHIAFNAGAFTTAELNAIGTELADNQGLTWTAIA